MVTDPISNLLTSIKNAAAVSKAVTTVPHSKLKASIADVLVREGYLKSASVRGKKVKKWLDLELAYTKTGESKLQDVRRMSKPSRRLYKGTKDLRPVRQGMGIEVLSTPQGLMTGKEARTAKLGGESLFIMW